MPARLPSAGPGQPDPERSGGSSAFALAYAAALQVPFVFLANGEEVRVRDLDAHFCPVATV
jgi:hypothetical protein